MARAWMVCGLLLLASPAWSQDGSFSVTPSADTYFQMGAFRTEGNAQAFARTLVREGFQPRLRRDGSLFRVYLVVKETESETLTHTLAQRGHTGFVQVWAEPRGTPLQVTSE